jgi:hypothetical protein
MNPKKNFTAFSKSLLMICTAPKLPDSIEGKPALNIENVGYSQFLAVSQRLERDEQTLWCFPG